MALYYMDLDRFKKINDVLGHDVGDALLQLISEKLRNLLRVNESIYRVGGDEFCVLVPEFKNNIMKPFCSIEHAEFYKKNIKGTPSISLCPYCKK